MRKEKNNDFTWKNHYWVRNEESAMWVLIFPLMSFITWSFSALELHILYKQPRLKNQLCYKLGVKCYPYNRKHIFVRGNTRESFRLTIKSQLKNRFYYGFKSCSSEIPYFIFVHIIDIAARKWTIMPSLLTKQIAEIFLILNLQSYLGRLRTFKDFLTGQSRLLKKNF